MNDATHWCVDDCIELFVDSAWGVLYSREWADHAAFILEHIEREFSGNKEAPAAS
jgi:hypothetical protein